MKIPEIYARRNENDFVIKSEIFSMSSRRENGIFETTPEQANEEVSQFILLLSLFRIHPTVFFMLPNYIFWYQVAPLSLSGVKEDQTHSSFQGQSLFTFIDADK